MMGAVVNQMLGLFIDDGFLAAAILTAVALAGGLALSGTAPTWLAGLLLALALPASLAASVLAGARLDRSQRD